MPFQPTIDVIGRAGELLGVLALIVLVRTFLSWSLEVEITGAWPWRRSRPASDGANRQQR